MMLPPFSPADIYIVAGAWFRTVPKNCRVLDLGFDVRLISPISGVEQFPRTRGKSDINQHVSSHVETVALMTRTDVAKG